MFFGKDEFIRCSHRFYKFHQPMIIRDSRERKLLERQGRLAFSSWKELTDTYAGCAEDLERVLRNAKNNRKKK